MTRTSLHNRTRRFSASAVRLCSRIPSSGAAYTLRRTILEHATCLAEYCTLIHRSETLSGAIYHLSAVRESLDALLYALGKLADAHQPIEDAVLKQRQECAELLALTHESIGELRLERKLLRRTSSSLSRQRQINNSDV